VLGLFLILFFIIRTNGYLWESLDESQQLSKVGGSQTSDGIPALGGEETVLGTAVFSALVVTSGDIVEDGGVRSVGLNKNKYM